MPNEWGDKHCNHDPEYPHMPIPVDAPPTDIPQVMVRPGEDFPTADSEHVRLLAEYLATHNEHLTVVTEGVERLYPIWTDPPRERPPVPIFENGERPLKFGDWYLQADDTYGKDCPHLQLKRSSARRDPGNVPLWRCKACNAFGERSELQPAPSDTSWVKMTEITARYDRQHLTRFLSIAAVLSLIAWVIAIAGTTYDLITYGFITSDFVAVGILTVLIPALIYGSYRLQPRPAVLPPMLPLYLQAEPFWTCKILDGTAEWGVLPATLVEREGDDGRFLLEDGTERWVWLGAPIDWHPPAIVSPVPQAAKYRTKTGDCGCRDSVAAGSGGNVHAICPACGSFPHWWCEPGKTPYVLTARCGNVAVDLAVLQSPLPRCDLLRLDAYGNPEIVVNVAYDRMPDTGWIAVFAVRDTGISDIKHRVESVAT